MNEFDRGRSQAFVQAAWTVDNVALRTQGEDDFAVATRTMLIALREDFLRLARDAGIPCVTCRDEAKAS